MRVLRHPQSKKFLDSGLFEGLSCFEELEQRICSINSENGTTAEKARGDAFEVFVTAYLATQPVHLVKSLWPQANLVPQALRKRLGWRGKDQGADGLIETTTGELRGYQVKFRTNRTPLPWRDVSSFFGVTDRCDDRVLITNSVTIAQVAENRRDFLSIRGNEFDKLGPADFRVMLDWLRGGPARHVKVEPLPHQREAIAAVLAEFKNKDRAMVVSACGTGKTLLAMWVAESISERSVLVLVPSLALMRQTLRDWATNTKWGAFNYLCVCSDSTVSREDDSLVVHTTELPFSVTTEVRKIRKFLRNPSKRINVVFSTYQSAPLLAAAMGPHDRFDIGIFDEAHKTAGVKGKRNAFALSDDNLRVKKRLFLTATPKKYPPPSKFADEVMELQPILSMDQPAVYGKLVYRMSFGEAARRGIICSYKVVISVTTSDLVNSKVRRGAVVKVRDAHVKAEQVTNQLALSQAIRKHGIGKVFTFHRNLRSAASFVSDGPEGIQTHLPGLATFHINGVQATALRDSIMREFQGAERSLVSNVRCLTEGVDLPAVDMVAFMAPKRSRVDIVQAVGRAMRSSPGTGKRHGYVLVPLHLDLKSQESPEEAVGRAGFDDIWQVLAALQEEDEVLNELIHRTWVDRKLGKGFDESRLREKIEIIGPPLALKALRKFIATRCIERLVRPWEAYVQMLLAFKRKHGHLRVSTGSRPPWNELATWVEKVRYQHRRGKLSPEQIDSLNRIGFVWRFEGESLDSVEGLLCESEFMKASGLSRLSKYREKGLIEPVGFFKTRGGLSAFFHPKQIEELKYKLGINLASTKGLLNEEEFKDASGLSQIRRYRRKGLITPVGYAMVPSKGVGPYYRATQINELRRALGVTLKSVTGLINEGQVRKRWGFSAISRYRKKGLIKPIGYALTNSGLSCFYHPRQRQRLERALGITLKSTRGLLSEREFSAAVGVSTVKKYLKQKILKPIGVGLGRGAKTAGRFYRRGQVKELRKKLGITLSSTQGLLNETQFARAAGLSQIVRYRKEGLVKPEGWASVSGAGVRPYYHPRQIQELRRLVGVTLDSTKGLLSRAEFKRRSGLSQLKLYEEMGLIQPVGYALQAGGRGGIQPFYRPSQIKQLKNALGITLASTEGLLSENQFRKASGLQSVKEYRERGVLKPIGFALANSGTRPYYAPNQIRQLKKKLGITLESTRGLLSEREFRRLAGSNRIAKFRKDGLLTPVGFAMSGPVVGAFYHPRQLKELRQKLGETLKSTEGLLSEAHLAARCRISLVAVRRFRRKQRIKPRGFALRRGRLVAFYHPSVIKILSNRNRC
jgi:superfamily II DNA or RNA helicase